MPFDSTVALNEVAEALLREELVGASHQRRAEIRKAIGELLRDRYSTLTDKYEYEQDQLENRAKRLDEEADNP